MKNSGSSSTGNDETFESIMRSLETITKTLESEETSLDISMREFEKGVALVRDAQATLNAAEQKVSELLANPKSTKNHSEGE